MTQFHIVGLVVTSLVGLAVIAAALFYLFAKLVYERFHWIPCRKTERRLSLTSWHNTRLKGFGKSDDDDRLFAPPSNHARLVMDKTNTTSGVFLRFIKLASAAFVIMVALTSFLSVAMWCAAFFAFWGNPPAFPWFIWRMFIGLSVFLSAAFGLIAAIIDPKDRP